MSLTVRPRTIATASVVKSVARLLLGNNSPGLPTATSCTCASNATIVCMPRSVWLVVNRSLPRRPPIWLSETSIGTRLASYALSVKPPCRALDFSNEMVHSFVASVETVDNVPGACWSVGRKLLEGWRVLVDLQIVVLVQSGRRRMGWLCLICMV